MLKSKRTWLLLVVFFMAVESYSQQFEWKTGFFGFFDDREYYNKYVIDQTIFGGHAYGEAGFALNDSNRFRFGIDYLYEFGSKGDLIPPDFILYYKGTYKLFDLYIGAFPRYGLNTMPVALLSDTFQYYRPNIEGMYLKAGDGSYKENAWIDWTGRQTYTTREAFLLGFSGMFDNGIFIYNHHFIMSHLALTGKNDSTEHIRDNGAFYTAVGLDLSSRTFFDTLTITTGLLASYDRIRGIYGFDFAYGWISEFDMNYKGFGIHDILYTGDSQVITSGDGFYKSTFYNRADVYYKHPIHGIEGRVQFSFHITPGTLDLSMALLVRAWLDGEGKIKPFR